MAEALSKEVSATDLIKRQDDDLLEDRSDSNTIVITMGIRASGT